jgi:hypothetical protein
MLSIRLEKAFPLQDVVQSFALTDELLAENRSDIVHLNGLFFDGITVDFRIHEHAFEDVRKL